jgi:hypothetical protein
MHVMRSRSVPWRSLQAALVAASLAATREGSAQMYRPPEPFGMWDTWLFQDGDDFHLFFLQSEPGLQWNAIGRAVSRDLVHWQPLPPIPTKGAPGEWDFAPTLTGCTVKIGSRYACFYGSPTHAERIGVMLSDDLLHWEKHPDNPILEIRPPHYGGRDWRDLCAVYDARQGLWHGYVCAQTGGAAPPLKPIGDKTLVAWVTLANLDQRGGSVLTLDWAGGPADAFDGIVFGEREPRRWMAGSDFWRRTEGEQSDYPPETAGPDELLQVAVAYAGKRITIYRNGERYREYESPGDPVVFASGTAIVMGLRHVGAAPANRFFAGTIEEARIYDVALDHAAVRSLRLGEPSDPPPIALWTFEDGTATDLAGTFPPGELHGGARIEGGRLHLNGEDAYVLTPAKPGGDAAIAHLTSKDLIHWDYHEPAFSSPDFANMEVPDYFELNGRHYLLFSSGGTRKDTGGRTAATGTFYAMADSRDGPYRAPGNCLLLASGRGRFDNYVARTIPYGNTRLLYHHTAGGPVTWGVPKLVRQNDDGTLWLEYWPGAQALETRVLLDEPKGIPVDDAVGPGQWRVRNSSVTAQAGGTSILWLPGTVADAMITCAIAAGECERAGLVWRCNGGKGNAVGISARERRIAILEVAAEGAISTKLLDDIAGVRMPAGPQHLRVLVRAHRVEVYLNDAWLFGVSLPEAPPSGRIGLLVEGGTAEFASLRVAELEPL